MTEPEYVCMHCDADHSTIDCPTRPRLVLDSVLERCTSRRQDAVETHDDEARETIDHAVLYLLTDAEYTAYTMAARAQDGDPSRRPWDNVVAFDFPYYCKTCRSFTGNDRHDHTEGDR